MHKNIIFFSKNHADNAVVSPGTSPEGDPPAINPFSNLKTEPPRDTWRSPDLTHTDMIVDMGEDAPPINAYCLIRHNFSVAATFSLYGHDSNIFPSDFANASFKTEDSNIFPAMFGAGEAFAGFGGAGGTLDTDDLPLYHRTRFGTFDTVRYRYWYFKFSDPTNTDGYIELGRLFLGWSWSPEINFSYGSGFSLVSRSKVTETPAGGVLTDIKIPYRQKKFKLSNLTDSEKFFDVYNTLKNNGIDGNMVISFLPDSEKVGVYFETFYGKIIKYSEIKDVNFDVNAIDMTFRELI